MFVWISSGLWTLVAIGAPWSGPILAPVESGDSGAVSPAGDSVDAREEASSRPAAEPAAAHVRNLAPGRAILRVERTESLVAVVRGLRDDAGPLDVVLFPPAGVTLLDDARHEVGSLDADRVVRIEWSLRAERAVHGTALVALRDATGYFEPRWIDLRFEAALERPSDYVPEPVPVRTEPLLVAHHCPLWKYGAHRHGWDTIDAWPERKPAIGFYDEGEPVVADWHIKYALEHGIGAFAFVWDKTLMNPLDKNSLAAAIDDGFLRARYRDRFQFCLNWTTNYPGHNGVRDAAEVTDEILPHWIEHYFTRPNYLRLDGRPVLFVTQPDALCDQLGGPEATRSVVDELRTRLRAAGFEGLVLIGCVPCPKPDVQERLARAGYDASSAYDLWTDGWRDARHDRDGIPVFSYPAMMAAQRDVLTGKKAAGRLPDVVSVHAGWDSRPWHGKDTVYRMAEPSAAAFELACRNAKRVLDATPGDGLDTRLVVINNWNEFGEGHFVAPTCGYGFGYLDAIRRVFTDTTEPCRHVIPEDLGLAPPDRIYRASHGILHDPYANGTDGRELVEPVAWWRFEEADDPVARDSSGNGFHGFVDCGVPTGGVRGKALACQAGGTVTRAVDAAFYPPDGFTLELWCRPTTWQASTYLVNTSSEPHTGYGLALEEGRPTFYLNWSHRVRAPEPIEPGVWSHLAVVSDGRDIALFVQGIEVARGRGAPVTRPAAGRVCLGAYSGTGSETFDGALDEVRIHGRVLTANEIADACDAR